MRLLLERRGESVSLLSPLKRGGEGSIHPIVGQPGLVAKLFSKPTVERAEKLRAMIENPPVLAGNSPIVLAWPQDRLLTPRGECVGYVMQYVNDMESLFTIAHPGTRPPWADYPFLLRVAKNVAVSVSAFHRHGYVVGDINESNFLVGKDASVAVVDTDSIQVRTTRGVLRCQVGKPEYTPPEIARSGKSFDQIDRSPHHDAFGLGVLIFQLLMDGNHPFAAQYVGAGGRQTQTERIAQGLWPYSKRLAGPYRPRREAPALESLPPELQTLITECFEAGHLNPVRRPTADAWHHALATAESESAEIRPRLRRFYYRALNRGAWGQKLLSALDWIRPLIARVPRKVWVTSACVLLITASILTFPSAPEQGPRPSPDPPAARGEQEFKEDEMPRLWREIRNQKR